MATIDKKKKFLQALKANAGNVARSAEQVNIGRQTYYYWYDTDEDFKKAVNDIQESLIDIAESKLHELITEKNPPSIMFFLKCKAKHRGYVERQELTGADGGPIPVVGTGYPSNSKQTENE